MLRLELPKAPRRYLYGGVILFLMIVVPVVMMVFHDGPRLDTRKATRLLTFFQVLFIFAMLPETLQTLSQSRRLRKALAIVFLAWFVCAIVWFGSSGLELWSHGRTWLYFVLPLFFVSAVTWFRAMGEAGFAYVARLKLDTVLIAVGVTTAVLLVVDTTGLSELVKWNPPVYTHLRHLNYEVLVGIALAAYGWLRSVRQQQARLKWLYLVILLVLGYVTFWSAGRGQAVATAFFFGLIVFVSSYRTNRSAMTLPIVGIALGALFVFFLGAVDQLQQTFIHTMSQSLDRISSGRISIWQASLKNVTGSYVDLLFGLGPDSFVRSDVWTRIVHPHNLIVQVVMDFGVLGAGVILFFAFKLIRLCFRSLPGQTAEPVVVTSALIPSIVLFSMVDGVLFHAIPLTTFLLFAAYLTSTDKTLFDGEFDTRRIPAALYRRHL